METTFNHYTGENFTIEINFYHEFQGRGGWKIFCDVVYNGRKQKFSHYTTSASFIDEINDLKADDAPYSTIQEAYHNFTMPHLSDIIGEWCVSVNEE